MFNEKISMSKMECLSEYDQEISLRPTHSTWRKRHRTLTVRISKGAKIRNKYNQVPHLTQDTNGKVTNSQIDTTNESQEVNSFPAGVTARHI